MNTTKTRLKNAEVGAKGELQKALDKATMAKDRSRQILSAFHEGESEDKDLQKAVKEVHNAIDHLKEYLNKYGDKKK